MSCAGGSRPRCPPHQIRADLIEIATVARDRLGDLPRAIETWREITTRFGEDQESVSALADLYATQGRFAELAELLSRNTLVDRDRHAAMLVRLADALRERLSQPRAATDWYGRALAVDPAHARARAGLSALLSDPAQAASAAETLARAAEKTDSWELLLELLPHRLAGSNDPLQRARLLEEAAVRAESRAGDGRRAFEWLCQALPQAPADARLKREVLRLAESTGGFARAAQALEEAMANPLAPPLLVAELAEQRGAARAPARGSRLGAGELRRGLALLPHRLELRQGLVRTAARVGHWAEAAAALVDAGVSPGHAGGDPAAAVRVGGDRDDSHRAAAAALSQAAEPGGRAGARDPARAAPAGRPPLPRPLPRPGGGGRRGGARPARGPAPPPHAAAAGRAAAGEARLAALWETLTRLAAEAPNDLDPSARGGRAGPGQAAGQRPWPRAPWAGCGWRRSACCACPPGPAASTRPTRRRSTPSTQLVTLQVAAGTPPAVRRATSPSCWRRPACASRPRSAGPGCAGRPS